MKKSRRFIILCMLSFAVAMTACGNTDTGIYADSSETETSGNAQVASSDAAEPLDKDDLDSADSSEGIADMGNAGDGIHLIMVGDMLLHDSLEDYARQEDGSWDYSSIFAHTSDLIQEADLAIANQEVMLGGEELGISGYPNFNGPFEFGDLLSDIGFDLVLHGTNHALDRGASGISNCLHFWEEAHPEMMVLGIHLPEEAETLSAEDNVLLFEENGITLALLNYTFSTNGIALPYANAVNMLEEETVTRDIAWAEEHADFTIVCPHWGTEYYLGIDNSQTRWMKLFLENGVDLVLGTHPHVIEPIAWEEDETTGHQMLVYYSLGNFVNWTAGTGSGTSDRMVGGMASITIGRDDMGNACISEDSVIPLICHLSTEEGALSVYPFWEYTEELGNENAIRLQDSAFSYDYCEKLIQDVWGDYEGLKIK